MKTKPTIKIASSIFLLASIYLTTGLNAAPKLGQGYDFEGNGKQRNFPCDQPLYQKTNFPKNIVFNHLAKSQKAADRELKRKKKDWKNGNYSIDASKLINTLNWLKNGAQVNEKITAKLIHGEDGCGNTHFTGYFTPVLELKTKPDNIFRYPLYRLPKQWSEDKRLTRRQIDIENGLQGQGLELGYSASLIDNYFAHVQGSVQVQYLDTGKTQTLAYGGKNGFSYTSLGRYLVDNGQIPAEKISLESIREYYTINPDRLLKDASINDSYTFFTPVDDGPFASSGAQVTPMVTAAVDPVYIPHGAVLLAEVPIIDFQNRVTGDC